MFRGICGLPEQNNVIFGSNQRRERPVHKIRNLEEEKTLRCLPNYFRSRGWISPHGSMREFVVSNDVIYGAPGACRSTIENLSLIYWF